MNKFYCISELKQHLAEMSGCLQQNVMDTVTMSGESNREHLCMQMDSILNTYCEIFIRLKKPWTNKV